MKQATRAVLCLVLSAAGAPGCKASVSANVNAGAKTGDDFDRPVDPDAMSSDRALESDADADVPLLGARQDLAYKGAQTAVCQCLAVIAGQPSDAAFQWSGKRPATHRESQLVIALSSAGVACSAAGAPGASYWGYEAVGDDVVVVVEDAAPGRPVAAGGIIPRPLGTGQVYVRPASKKVVYGRPLSGTAGRCQVGQLTPSQSKPAGGVAPASEPGRTTTTGTAAGGVRIRTDEADPTSTEASIP